MFDDKSSDPAGADDAYGHPPKPATDAAVPLSVSYLGVDCHRSPQQREHLSYGQLSTGGGGPERVQRAALDALVRFDAPEVATELSQSGRAEIDLLHDRGIRPYDNLAHPW